jgi:micrococcal nuclease
MRIYPNTKVAAAVLLAGGLLMACSTPQAAHAAAGSRPGPTTSTKPTTTTPRTKTTTSTTATVKRTPPKRLVVRVVDGDTLDTIINGRLERVRLIGIDTPETVHPSRPVECFGPQASTKVRKVLEGRRVWFERDRSQGDRDRYGRLLRYVHSPINGKNFNHALVAQGYAHEYTYATAYKYQASFRAAERHARAAGRGLWGACSTTSSKPTTKPRPPVSGWVDRDCRDFATERAAQAYFDRRGGSRANNVDGLDNDRDGLACEILP